MEGDIGDHDGCRCSQTAKYVGIIDLVGGDNRYDDLGFKEVAVRKKRSECAVDQPCRENFFFGGAAFTLEEASGKLARRRIFFAVFNLERKVVLIRWGRFFARYNRRQHHGVAKAYNYGAVGLFMEII